MMPERPWVSHHAACTPDRPALRDLGTGRTLTYRRLDERVRRAAEVLRSAFGAGTGDRVAVLSPNTSNVIEIQEACRLLDAIFVPLNTRLALPELTYIVDDAEPTVLLAHDGLRDLAIALADACHVPRMSWGGHPDEYEDALLTVDPVEVARLPDEEHAHTIIYTSGTTGRPKGAITTGRGAVACILNSSVAGGVGPGSVNLAVLPLFHVAGLNLFLNATLYMGGQSVILPEFDPKGCLELLTDPNLGISHVVGVPAVFQFMADQPEFEHASLGVRFAGVGGAPSPPALFARWGTRGVELRNIYGITEATATVCVMPPDRADDKPGSVGRPTLHTSLRVVDRDGAEVPAGHVGELQVAGPVVSPGYWRQPDATAQAFVDGWLRTGDAACLDADGFCTIVDRWKDMYISGGENVYPAEVEAVLHDHPAVADAAVVGVPDARWGEAGVAVVVIRPGHNLTAADVTSHCRRHLAAYKVPTAVQFVDGLPRNAIGKVRRVDLREMLTTSTG